MLQSIPTHKVKSPKLNAIKRHSLALMLRSYSMSMYYGMKTRYRQEAQACNAVGSLSLSRDQK